MNKELELFKMKLLSTGLLLFVTVLFVVARIQHESGFWPWVAAFAEAAMVGALADWFAVVALFKHPMGLPIPHTAIVSQNKGKIADNLAEFVRDKFLDVESLVVKVRQFDPAEKLAEWLQRKENVEIMGDRMALFISGALDVVDDDRIKSVMEDALRKFVSKIDLSKSAGQILDTLTTDNRHQALLDEIIGVFAGWMNEAHTQKELSSFIAKWIEQEYKYLSKALPTEGIGNFATGKVVAYLNGLLQRIHNEPEHVVRKRFEDGVQKLIHQLKHDPEFQRKGDEIKHKLLNDPALNSYLHELWNDLKVWLRNDLEKRSSVIRRKIIESAQWMGEQLAKDESLRNALNDHLEDAARKMAPELVNSITHHISGTVKSWNDADMSREIELSVGKDLQFIRLNGTIVGGGIGVTIYAVSLAFQ